MNDVSDPPAVSPDDAAPNAAAEQPAQERLTRFQLYMLAVASAIVVANAYYIHPIIALVAEDFGVGAAMIGAVPALNQIALAVGIFLFLPLGDRFGNGRLAGIFVAAQFVAVAAMALAGDFRLFVIASTLLGLATIAPYLIPAYVSKRVEPGRMGSAMAFLTVGIIVGILFARLGAGLLGEYLGWRTVYYVAAALMLVMAVALPRIMGGQRQGAPAPERSYWALLLSTFPIARRNPDVLLSGAIQGLNFGIFLSVWLGIGLHLPRIGYGVDTVGYLAGFSIVNLFSTPWLGAWSDRVGAQKARLVVASGQLVGIGLLFLSGESVWVLAVPVLIMNLVGPVIDITGRVTFLSEAPEIRTRLMTVYIILMFIGGGAASWAGTAAYDLGGWTGTCLLALGLSLSVLSLSFLAWRRGR